ncbi:MAG: class I SAM-dependent methyltransferase [Hyphomicrobiales bacterium]
MPKTTRGKYRALPGEWRGWLSLRLNGKLYSDLQQMLKQSTSTGCTYFELGLLYREILKTKPKRVLELGSGVSTLVLAHAARKLQRSGHECHVVSMEESEPYYTQLRGLLPPEAARYVDLIRSDVVERSFGSYIGRSYALTPKVVFDLVFIDGPQLERKATYFDADILDVIERNPKPFTAFLDGRKSTREILAKIAPWLGIDYDPVHRWSRIAIPDHAARTTQH